MSKRTCEDCKYVSKMLHEQPCRDCLIRQNWQKNNTEVNSGAITTADEINHPSHYCKGGIECIDAIEAAVSNLTGIEAVCTANAIKYLWRWKEKNGRQDLEKAEQYIRFLLGDC